MEYVYTSSKATHKGNKQTHGIKAIGKANSNMGQSDDLLQGFSVSSAPPEAIEDCPRQENGTGQGGGGGGG